MLFYYTCCIFPFNYLLHDDGEQLAEPHCVINCINKNNFASLNTFLIITYKENVIKKYKKMPENKSTYTLTVISNRLAAAYVQLQLRSRVTDKEEKTFLHNPG